ncbi:MAG TPA: hypothetical protein ENJ69_05085, partial [Bacteroidetes bacterium]|nr:hypothetical protein [Bacteroidota bacterium]
MKGMKGKFLLLITGMLLSIPVYSQTLVKGQIMDVSTHQPIGEAHIVLNNGKDGVVTTKNGTFSFRYPANRGVFYVERMGYKTRQVSFRKKGDTTLLPPIGLQPTAYPLNEINITAGLVTDKKTPINVSTISARTIKSRRGDQPLPLILNSVPGVFSVRNGGGSGDATLSIRGFKQDNVALLLNGIPING